MCSILSVLYVYDVTALGTLKHCRKINAGMESGSTSGAVSECVQTLWRCWESVCVVATDGNLTVYFCFSDEGEHEMLYICILKSRKHYYGSAVVEVLLLLHLHGEVLYSRLSLGDVKNKLFVASVLTVHSIFTQQCEGQITQQVPQKQLDRPV